MTMRNRQILVAAGLVILAVWVVLTWFGSSSTPEPTSGPSPTGAIGSGPPTFGPSDGAASPSPAGSTAGPGSTSGTSPGGSGNPVSPPPPGTTDPPAQAVRWSGTWTNTSPDNASGSLEIVWTQNGRAVDGTLAMPSGSCFTAGAIQGTVDGDKLEFEVVGRDEVSFIGTITGARASGTFSMSCDGSQGTWEATRQP